MSNFTKKDNYEFMVQDYLDQLIKKANKNNLEKCKKLGLLESYKIKNIKGKWDLVYEKNSFDIKENKKAIIILSNAKYFLFNKNASNFKNVFKKFKTELLKNKYILDLD